MIFNKLKFYIEYFFYRMIAHFYEVEYPCLRCYLYQLMLFFNQISGIELFPNQYFNISKIKTTFGVFNIRPFTLDFFCSLPAFERPDINNLFNYLKQYSDQKVLFLDIGADFGTYTVAVGNAFKNNTLLHTYSFEPTKSSFELLSRNVQENNIDTLCTLHNFGLSDTTKSSTISFNDSMPGHTSLETTNDGTTENVFLKKLDAVLDSKLIDKYDVFILKMDIEGHEVPCLKGASTLLSSNKKIILMVEDFVDTRVIDYLGSIGFSFVKKVTPYNSWWTKN